MVRIAIPLFCLLLGTASMAQEGQAPPVVTGEAPVTVQAGQETAPRLPAPPAMTVEAPDTAVETDLVSLVLRAHWVVQAVMGLLTLAIAAVMTVFLFKTVEFALVFARLRRAHAGLAAGAGLVALAGHCPLAEASRVALDEVAGLPALLTADLRASARERLEMSLDRIEARAVARMKSGTGLLASIGAVGPFVGLFGTVFGIMNSFLAIAATRTTSLSVVAPGIAEALLATGIGLVAAIPAVLLYNGVMRRIASFRHGLADGRAELQARFSRELDRRMTAGH